MLLRGVFVFGSSEADKLPSLNNVVTRLHWGERNVVSKLLAVMSR